MSATDKELRVRELAYQIWETEGRPDGQDARHWELANKLAEVEVRDEPMPTKRSPGARKPREAQVAAATVAVAPITVEKTTVEKTLPPASRKSRATKTTGTAKTDAPNAASKLRDTTET